MFSSINSTYHWHTSHNCVSLTYEDRVKVHGTQGTCVNYWRGPKKEPPFYQRNGREKSGTGKPYETRKWYRHFLSESLHRENRTTFSDVPLISNQKHVIHLHPNQNFRNLMVIENGHNNVLHCTSQYLHP